MVKDIIPSGMDLGFLRTFGPLLLAIVFAWMIDRSTSARGLEPPGFSAAPDASPLGPSLRRVFAMSALALVLWIGVFAPLGLIGVERELPAELATPQLFQLHLFFVLALLIWFALGFGGGSRLLESWRRQFGLRRAGAMRELALGSAVGVGAWLSVLVVLMLVGSLVYLLAGEESLPESPPQLVVWLAGLPLVIRFALSLSAGVVEELFFRGFLQPRVGIGLSTGAFVLAHASYEQPLMLVGITLLSLIFAGLVRWRQSIWAAIAAHAVFDCVQLLFVIPQLLDFLQPGELGAAPMP